MLSDFHDICLATKISLVTMLFSVENPKGDFFIHALDFLEVLRSNACHFLNDQPELTASMHKQLQSLTSDKLEHHLQRYVW